MQTEVTDIKNLINQRMTNIIKKRTEQTTEKTGISFVETVDISGLWRKETIAKYKKLSEKMMCDDDYECSFENSYAKSKTEKAYKKSFERFCENFANFKHDLHYTLLLLIQLFILLNIYNIIFLFFCRTLIFYKK